MFDWDSGGGMMGSGGGAMMVFGMLMMLGFLVLVVLGIWALIVWLRENRSHAPGPAAGGSDVSKQHSARQVLDERYARGELNTEEYRERLERLEGLGE